MYEYINGILVDKALDYALIDNNGLCYIIYIPFKTYEKLNIVNEKQKLYLYQFVKEDDLRLYGFSTKEEREIFKLTISVSGIGPKIALAILSFFSPQELSLIFKNDDHMALSKVNGLGVKKAQKLIIELKDKIPMYDEPNDEKYELFNIKNDIKLALQSLGFDRINVEQYLTDEHILEVKDSSALMREILKAISKAK